MAKKFKVTVIGHPGSGKSAFLASLQNASLSETAKQSNESESKFSENTAAFRQGKAMVATVGEPPEDVEIKLPVDGDSCFIQFKSQDFAGESTLVFNEGLKKTQFRTNAARNFQASIKNSDGVLFFADCHTVQLSGGWPKWFKTHAKPILAYVKEVIPSNRRHPVVVLLSRSDLVEETFKEKILSDAKNSLTEMGLNAEVKLFQAFTSKAGKPAPAGETAALSDEFITPASPNPVPKPDPRSIVETLWNLHQSSRAPQFLKFVAGGLLLILALVFWASEANKPKPQTPIELAAVLMQMPDDLSNEAEAERIAQHFYRPPDPTNSRPPWSRMVRYWLNEMQSKDEAIEKVKQLYKDGINKEAEELANTLEYSFRESNGHWTPSDTNQLVQQYEQDLRWLNDKNSLDKIGSIRKKKLDSHLPSIASLAQDQLVHLEAEYQRYAGSAPTEIVDKISRTTYAKCVKNISNEFQKHVNNTTPTDLRKLYASTIPAIINKAIAAGSLTNVHRKNLNAAQFYLQTILKTNRLTFSFSEFCQYDLDEEFEAGICIQVIPADGTATRFTFPYPPEAPRSDLSLALAGLQWSDIYTQDAFEGFFAPEGKTVNLLEKPISFTWSLGDRIVIDVWDQDHWDEHLVKWDSNKPGPRTKNYGSNLPGLTFTVFDDADVPTFGIARKDARYQLKIVRKGTSWNLLWVPELLRAALVYPRQLED